MFCMKCGKEISTESKFCLHCGKPVESATNEGGTGVFIPPVTTVAAPQSAPQTKWKLPVRTGASQMGTGFGWLGFGLFSILVYGLFVAVLMQELFTSKYIRPPFGEIFGMSLLVGLISFVLFAVGYWLLHCIHHQALANFCQTSNALAASLVPLTCAYLFSMLLGLFWADGVIFVILFGLVYLIASLWQKLQAIEVENRDPVWGFALMTTLLIVLVVLIGEALYNALFESMTGINIGKIFNMLT